MATEYVKKHTDLSNLLPVRIRDKTLTNVIKNLYNRFLTKNESATIFGYVGDRDPFLDVNSVYLTEPNLERSVNTLIPTVYTKHATTEHVITWNDIIQKMELLGVDTHNVNSWAAVKQFNLVPPIDLDKFCNYKEYFWLGPWVKAALANLKNDWTVVAASTTDSREQNVISFEITDVNYVDASGDEVWTISFPGGNEVIVTGSTVGFDGQTILDSDHDTIITGLRTKIIIKKDNYQTGDVITIKMTRLNNPYVSIFNDLLGIDNVLKVQYVFIESNPYYFPEYYVIEKPNASYDSFNDWAKVNLWAHKDDVLTFLKDNFYLDLSIDDIFTSTRPIIQYNLDIQLNGKISSGGPVDLIDTGTAYQQVKKHRNQVPLFDLFYSNGKHARKVSPIFYYAEGNNFEIDPMLGRRLEINRSGDFIFEQSLYDASKDELLFYKTNLGKFKTIWVPGSDVTPEYLKTDVTGTIINIDKFNNYSNYYWVGHLLPASAFPLYYADKAGQPEYTCIQKTGDITDNDWQSTNYWMHVSQLDKNSLGKYLPATKPIIEFNSRLVPSLVTSIKSGFDQKPQFTLFEFNDVTDQYDALVTSTSNPFKDDIIASNYVLVLNDDLPSVQKSSNEETYEIYTDSMFKFEGANYVQSLHNFYYEAQQYVNPLTFPVITYRSFNYYGSVGGADISNLKILTTGGLQTWTLKYNVNASTLAGHAVFEVHGSKTGLEDSLAHAGTTYSNGKVTFLITYAGSTPTDYFEFQFNSSLKYKQQNFVKLKVDLTITTGSPEDADNYVYKSVEEAINIIQAETAELVPGNQTLKDGVFKTPQAVGYNANNENRNKIDQGDLIFHFGSIIEAQPDLVGQPLSSNNFRLLPSPELGIGGTIKQFNSQYNLFLGLMNQKNLTPLSLIEFAKAQYANLQTQATDYAINWALDRISDGTLNTLSPTWKDDLFEFFKTDYLLKQNTVVVESSSVVDDTLAQLFYDTTSPLPNTIITLPQLGLASRVYPSIGLDEELGIMMLTHHDGHKTKVYNYSVDLIKKYVSKSYLRSSGQYSTGSISAKTPPSRPFKNQFWFDTASNSLYYYNVVSDTGEFVADQMIGRYSYDRANNSLYEFDGIEWNPTGAITAPWTIIPNIVDDLVLRIEQELYNRIHPTSDRLDIASLEASPLFDGILEDQFNDFGNKYKIPDLYNTSYDPNNAFTWNYSSVLPFATWQDNYISLYGTSRPDLYPWKIVNQTESTFITNVGGVGNMFTPTMWLYVKGLYASPISVDTNTNKLLPPWVTAGNPASVEALMTVVPSGIANRYEFGDNGIIERVWRKSIEFNYDKVKAYFKLDPINFVNETWGYYDITINEYEFNRYKSKKLAQTDFTLHNERKDIAHQYGDILVTALPGYANETYVVDIVNRLDSYYRVTRSSDSQEFYHLIESTFTDANVELTVSDKDYYQGLSQGDKWIITLVENQDPSVTFVANPNYSYTGFNQIYVQYLRQEATSLDTTLNVSLLREYEIKLGYRMSGFIDNGLTTIKADTFNLDSSDWKTLIKENKLMDDLWAHALRVQVVQKGSTTIRDNKQIPATAPGDPEHLAGKDWIFRVETFNKNKSKLDFYEYDLNGTSEPFTAINQQNSLETWLRYRDITNTRTEYAPFLVQGIQNLITFIIGYSEKLKDAGWNFYDPVTPVTDPETGRILDWQLDIEYMINFLFSGGVKAGLGYILNPFKNSIWINTPRGQVADLTEKSLYDFETTQSVINAIGSEIKPSNYRVFRNNDNTEIVSDEPMYGVHVTVSEYEHLMLFENYASNINLVYDPFLGQRVYRFHIVGQKQVSFLGRPSFGGRFLIGNEMRQNLESSVEGILNFYDANKMLQNAPETDRARGLLGYTEKQYFSDNGLTDHSSFRFWQGMIPNKGSNLSLDAFSNQVNYRNVGLDEFWAYRIAEYGDMGQIKTPEIKVYLEDIQNQYAHYKFIEDDESDADYGYDIFQYNVGGFGGGNVLIEQDDIFGYTKITSTDEKYWYTLDDLGSHQYFEAELLAEVYIVPHTLDQIYSVVNNEGKRVYADCFEVVTPYIPATESSPEVLEKVYRETGSYDPLVDDFTEPSFERINSFTIKFKNPDFVDKILKIKCYGRPRKAYGPMRIIDYKHNVVSRDDVILWDPLHGVHNYRAMENIDIVSLEDPARYNQSIHTTKNLQYEPLRPWEENQLGKTWWDQSFLTWKPYHDTKIIRSVLDRIYSWGSLADYSRINVYQWIESPVPPSEYEKYVETQSQIPTSDFSQFRPTGVPLKHQYERTRKWQHRTVAWKYSDNVCNFTRKFITGTNERIIISSTAVGKAYAYLTTNRFSNLGLSSGDRFSNAIWNTTNKLTEPTADVTAVFGESIILSDPTYVVGSGCEMSDGGIYADSTYFTDFKVTLDDAALANYLTDVEGQIIFDKEIDQSGYYHISATIKNNNRSQRLLVVDTPARAGTTISYRFDDLGITLSARTVFDNGSTGLATAQDRINKVATYFGNTAHNVFIREQVEIMNLVPYEYYYTNPNTGVDEYIQTDQLYSAEDVVEMSWVAWHEPTDLDGDDDYPMNKWEAVFGEYVDIGTDLQTVAPYIREQILNLKTSTRLALYKKYDYVWNDWNKSSKYLVPRVQYYLPESDPLFVRQTFFETYLLIPYGTGAPNDILSISNREKKVDVFVNRRKVPEKHWSIVNHPLLPRSKMLTLDDTVYLRSGDLIEVLVNEYSPTQEEFSFDPDNFPSTDDPMKLYQFKFDYPHTKRDQYTEYGYKGTPKYYFWAKDIKSKMSGKALSTSVITNLLVNNTDPYAIIQSLKFFNPIDERPNRYSLLTVKNLSQFVTASNTYKLRITTDFSLRDKNTSLDLKNVHNEWILLREQQSSRIPRELWDSIINSMCGENAIGEKLPSYRRELYDRTNGTKYRYGFGQDQVLADQSIINATVSYTISNTSLNKYINETDYIPDTIDFQSFGLDSTGTLYDISKLDFYLSSTYEIRKLMENIWTKASPKQINEIFFSVLNDVLSQNNDLKDLFKTSIVAMQTTRVITTDSTTGQFTSVIG